ncbi:MAG: manganese efflux pump MntP family protein [Methanomassiliicoccaceae archaeon]|jgi:putative Mn2+ efflux pump MntP|nr:manganese efflux pump MntP family protein [Methanomassiliicoccaceae archaeon]
MNFIEIFLIALAVSMDAFAVAVCLGLRHGGSARNMLTVGAYFCIFPVALLLIGYYAATLFAERTLGIDHWIAFALLTFIGIRMIVGSFGLKEEGAFRPLRRKALISLAVVTSIDAMAVGISFAVIHIDIVSVVLILGVVAFALAMIGVRIGCTFGTKVGSRAEFAGGVVLVLMGIMILLEHYDILVF